MQLNGAVPRARARARTGGIPPPLSARAPGGGELRRPAASGAEPRAGARFRQRRAQSGRRPPVQNLLQLPTRAAPARGASGQARGGVARACSRPPAFEWWAPPPPHTPIPTFLGARCHSRSLPRSGPPPGGRVGVGCGGWRDANERARRAAPPGLTVRVACASARAGGRSSWRRHGDGVARSSGRP